MEAVQVVEKILSEARAEAGQITSEAQVNCDAQDAELKSELEKYRSETESAVKKAAAEKTERMLAIARMENKKEYLSAKVQFLREVFTNARRRVKEMSDEEYKPLMASLITKAVETGDEEIVIGRDENRIDHDMVNQINSKLDNGNLKISDVRADIDGGFILRRGNIQVNVCLDVLLNQLKEELEIDFVKELFE